MTEDLPISLVVIGLNEGSRLHQTFNAIKNMNYSKELVELIYVDSGSTDKSVEIARQYCDKIFIEPKWPTAARNRNRGLIESCNDFCHFLDGDILIDANYIRYAIERLVDGDVQAVFGYLEEKSNRGLSRILLHDYSNRTPGYISAPGAGGTFLKKALIDVNGWDERIPRGEESEIGERLRKAGFKIWFMDQKMGVHDFGVHSLWQFIRKQIKEGKSFAQITLIENNEFFFKQARRLSVNNLVFHILFLLLMGYSIIIQSVFLLPGCVFFYGCYLYIKYRFIKKNHNSDTIKYFFLINFTRSFVLYGFLKFRIQFLFLPLKIKNMFYNRINIKDEIDHKQI